MLRKSRICSKTLYFSVLALVFCQIGFKLAQNYKFIEKHKYIFYGIIGALVISILLFTGSRGMWIDLGFITIQPSEFIKPFFALVLPLLLRHSKIRKNTWNKNRL